MDPGNKLRLEEAQTQDSLTAVVHSDTIVLEVEQRAREDTVSGYDETAAFTLSRTQAAQLALFLSEQCGLLRHLREVLAAAVRVDEAPNQREVNLALDELNKALGALADSGFDAAPRR